MTGIAKRSAVLVAGWSLLGLGALGLFLPVLPGVALLLAGVSVLSSEYVWAHRILQRVYGRFPGFGRRVQAAEHWTRARWGSHFPGHHKPPDAGEGRSDPAGRHKRR